jgi:hypothetical protein
MYGATKAECEPKPKMLRFRFPALPPRTECTRDDLADSRLAQGSGDDAVAQLGLPRSHERELTPVAQ